MPHVMFACAAWNKFDCVAGSFAICSSHPTVAFEPAARADTPVKVRVAKHRRETSGEKP